jgi:hypothetical protein
MTDRKEPPLIASARVLERCTSGDKHQAPRRPTSRYRAHFWVLLAELPTLLNQPPHKAYGGHRGSHDAFPSIDIPGLVVHPTRLDYPVSGTRPDFDGTA